MIPFHAVDGRVDDLDLRAALLDDALADALDSLLAGFGIADNPSLAYIVTTGFELRFDQNDSRAFPVLPRCAKRSQHCRENKGRGDKRDIHREKSRRGATEGEQFARSEKARISSLAKRNAGIVAKLLGDLAVASVDGKDSGGSALEHAIGKATRGGSDIDAGETSEVD